MSAKLRLRGQEIQLRVTADGVPVNEVSGNITSFNDATERKLDEQGFLGEVVNRYDYTISGFTGDIEFQINSALWLVLEQKIDAKGQRLSPGLVFNVVRTDLFADGSSALINYSDISWGNTSTTVGSRADFVKVKTSFKCSVKTSALNVI